MKRTTILLCLLLGIGALIAQNTAIGRYPNQQVIYMDSLIGDSVHTQFMDEKGVVFHYEAHKAPSVSSDTFLFVFTEAKPVNMKEVCGAVSYPDSLRRAGIKGTVVLRIFVLVDGSVGGIKVVRADHDALLKLIIPNMHQLTFVPAIQEGMPIPFWVSIPFVFGER